MDHLDKLGEGEIEVRNHVQISGPGRIAISLKKTNIQEKNRNSEKMTVFSDRSSLSFLHNVDGTPEAGGQPCGNRNFRRHWEALLMEQWGLVRRESNAKLGRMPILWAKRQSSHMGLK